MELWAAWSRLRLRPIWLDFHHWACGWLDFRRLRLCGSVWSAFRQRTSEGTGSLVFRLTVMLLRRLEFQYCLLLLGMARRIFAIFSRLYFGKLVAGWSIFWGGR